MHARHDLFTAAGLTLRVQAFGHQNRIAQCFDGLRRIGRDPRSVFGLQRNAKLGMQLNSCLLGLYANGDNHVNWHADDEPELLDRIVSLSLGATRTFNIREGTDGEPIPLALDHGSVLVMTVESQKTWQHSVPREPAAGPRMNLTFRTIAPH